MAKQTVAVVLPVFDQPSTGPNVTLYRQIYERVRGTILTGGLAPGTRLPSSRTLATDIGVSRSTVELAFSQLEAEGFLSRRGGAGTYLDGAPRTIGDCRNRINRGGSWTSTPGGLRSAGRGYDDQAMTRVVDLGFRIARGL